MLDQLEPKLLWHHFAQICRIPHPSYHEEALIQQLEAFAEQQQLEHFRDRAGNLIIRKPASLGCEQAPGVILQSHVDMVPQKTDDSGHDFQRDPIQPRIVDGWVHATDTTLGADNGIGVAASLAALESTELRHGPLEALFTINEESGMDGAKGLEPGRLQGELLLNLDSEQEGELYVGCAGGIDASARLPLQRQALNPDQTGLQLIVRGLAGGHSGLDIHLGRGNANQLLAGLLQQLGQQFELQLIDFRGGTLRNAISRRAEALIAVPSSQCEQFRAALEPLKQKLIEQFQQVEPQLAIGLLEEPLDNETALDADSYQRLIEAILACPHGVERMHPDLDGVVETSNNLAAVRVAEQSAELQCLARSAIEAQRDKLCQRISQQLTPFGADCHFDGAYPGWSPQLNSPLLATLQQVHQQQFGQPAEVMVIHAGLECGLLQTAYPNWQMISFGPTIRFPHSPGEKVEIASVERFWDYLGAVLKALAD
ncbi:aminoacyl-histidine dipeptidase [Motiliproteus coralliicola]|uniref:Cytosol non-specific dipeptidase n=1 Tax=Motiliproteus coralliicola TaxID=2283196 RepID=A0A369X009_9GAMM|nr:aminoacyl-histidine dipeptidase [Motiliproteus coralliicola]RDE25105.1 aminoacyl-histidine dipeptidase [Motiliproteus coralliicola]